MSKQEALGVNAEVLSRAESLKVSDIFEVKEAENLKTLQLIYNVNARKLHDLQNQANKSFQLEILIFPAVLPRA